MAPEPRLIGIGLRRRGTSLKPLYFILMSINAIALAVILLFFMWGLADGTVQAWNGPIWLVMLLVPSATLFGGWVQWGKGHRAFAVALLAIPSLPAILAGLFILMFIILQPDMR
jgi:hypothetical protein